MQSAFVGVDLAIAKGKYLPVVVCTRESGRLIPKPLRRLSIIPPRGAGNAAILHAESPQRFAREAAAYIRAVCAYIGVTPARIAIDAPSAPRDPLTERRAAEKAMDMAGISCFATPSALEFEAIRQKAHRHLARGGTEDRIPHANQLWMLAGFALFAELSHLAPCLEVFPQAIARATGSGHLHKSRPGAVEAQLGAAARYTGWPAGDAAAPQLHDIAWGPSHDQLDAYLSAWVASLDETARIAYGVPPDDVIWVPKTDAGEAPSVDVVSVARAPRPVAVATATVLCPACQAKAFKRWPWGWDAHAAHACAGLESTEPEARKAEFRRRFVAHFEN